MKKNLTNAIMMTFCDFTTFLAILMSQRNVGDKNRKNSPVTVVVPGKLKHAGSVSVGILASVIGLKRVLFVHKNIPRLS